MRVGAISPTLDVCVSGWTQQRIWGDATGNRVAPYNKLKRAAPDQPSRRPRRAGCMSSAGVGIGMPTCGAVEPGGRFQLEKASPS